MEAAPPRQLTAKDWITAAWAAFEKGGVDAVRIVPLATSLGVSRGSFYWHFEDRDALLLDVLRLWSVSNCHDVIDANEKLGGVADVRLLRLIETCARDDGHLEMTLRSWAQTDARAGMVMAEVDATRIAYLAKLIAEATRNPKNAEAKARVTYAAWLGEYTALAHVDEATRVANMRCLHDMLLKDYAAQSAGSQRPAVLR
jgi:AcrR family transcriptional regulator